MPLHKNSLYAAAVLEEARELGKFEEALEILFEKQPEWGSHRDPRPELIPAYLQPLGIPSEKLERSYVEQKHAAKSEARRRRRRSGRGDRNACVLRER